MGLQEEEKEQLYVKWFKQQFKFSVDLGRMALANRRMVGRLKSSVTFPSITDAGAGLAVDALDSVCYAETGEHLSSSAKASIKSGIASTAMSLLTGAIDNKMSAAISPPWSGTISLRPEGVQHTSGPGVTLNAGVISRNIPGSPAVRWAALVQDLVSGNYNHMSPLDNVSASLSVSGSGWDLNVGGGYSHVLNAPSATRSHAWGVTIRFSVKLR